MTLLLENESRQVDSVAGEYGDQADWLNPAPASAHRSALTLVTVTVLDAGDPTTPEPGEEADDHLQLGPLPRISDLVLNVVQTDSDGRIRRWSGPSAAGAGVPAGPGAILHLQPAASHEVAAVDRSLAIQAEQDRRPRRASVPYRPRRLVP